MSSVGKRFEAALCLSLLALAGLPATAQERIELPHGEELEFNTSRYGGIGTGSIARHLRDGSTAPSFDGFGYLRLTASSAGGPTGAPAYVHELDIQRTGPRSFASKASRGFDGIAVSRSIDISDEGEVVQFIDRFTNLSDQPLTVEVAFGGALGRGLESLPTGLGDLQRATAIGATSSGDRELSNGDYWFLIHHPGPLRAADDFTAADDAVLVITAQSTGEAELRYGDAEFDPFKEAYPGRAPEFIAAVHRIELNSLETKSLMHFVLPKPAAALNIDLPDALAAGRVERWGMEQFVRKPSRLERCTLANFPSANKEGCEAALTAYRQALGSPTDLTPRAKEGVQQELSLVQMSERLAAGQTTSVALTQRYLDRIDTYDRAPGGLQTYISLNPSALKEAMASDARRADGKTLGPLDGIPFSVKDNIDVAGLVSTAGTAALPPFTPSVDNHQVGLLKQAGAVVLGKVALGELASGRASSISGNHGTVRNPYRNDRGAGASSGGSGASVAADLAAFSLGGDSKSSLRGPAAINGLVAFMPTFGYTSAGDIQIARGRPLPTSNSLPRDRIGPLTRSVEAMALVLDVTAKADPAAPYLKTADQRDFIYAEHLDASGLRGKRIGVWRKRIEQGGDLPATNYQEKSKMGAYPEPRFGNSDQLAVEQQVRLDLMRAGAELVEVDLPMSVLLQVGECGEGPLIGYTRTRGWWESRGITHDDIKLENMAPAQRWPDIDIPGFVMPVIQFFAAGAYTDLMTCREQAAQAVESALDQLDIDALYGPELIGAVPILDSRRSIDFEGMLSSYTGLPEIVLPAGLDDRGMPFGFGLLGRRGADGDLIAMGYAYEQFAKKRRPPEGYPD
ncbi:MAG: amidase family protein [Pseudomonadota bacterium]